MPVMPSPPGPLREAREILTIPETLRRSAAQFGPRIALRTWRGGRYLEITYGELAAFVERLADALVDAGLERGDRVALLSENRPEWVAVYLGSLAASLVVVPVDPRLREGELQTILRRAEARAVFASGTHSEMAADARAAVRDLEWVIALDTATAGRERHTLSLAQLAGGWDEGGELAGERPEGAARSDERWWRGRRAGPRRAREHPGLDDLAAVLFTSGTSGLVKGVMLTHRSIMTNVESLYQAIAFDENLRLVSVLPLHHALEATSGMLAPLSAGASITYARSLKSRDILTDLLQTRATTMIGVPLLFDNLLRGIDRELARRPAVTRAIVRSLTAVTRAAGRVGGWDVGGLLLRGVREKAGLGSVKFLVCGGAPLRAETVEGFALLGIPLLQGYGLTEAGPVLTVNSVEANRAGSVGVPLPGVEIRIHEPNKEGVGEVLARGDNMMAGYFGDEALTEKTIRGGWLFTGDLGWIDDQGYLHLVGRLKDVIVTSAGKNVYPEEVEAELVKSPYIAEALVVGRRDPGTGGEEVHAIIVVDEEALSRMEGTRGSVLSGEELHGLLREEVRKSSSRLARYKCVKKFEIRREGFPTTSSKKIKRYLFKERAIPV